MFANLRNALYKLFPEDCQGCYQKSQADFANYPTIATGSLAVAPPFEPAFPDPFFIQTIESDANNVTAVNRGIVFTPETDTELTAINPRIAAFGLLADVDTAIEMRDGAGLNGSLLFTSDEITITINTVTDPAFDVQGSPVLSAGQPVTFVLTQPVGLSLLVQDNNVNDFEELGNVNGATFSATDPIVSLTGTAELPPPPVPFLISVPNTNASDVTLAANSLVFTPAQDVQLSDLELFTTVSNIFNPPTSGISILQGELISGLPIFTTPQVQLSVSDFTTFNFAGSPVLQAGQPYSFALTNQSGNGTRQRVGGAAVEAQLGTFNGLSSTTNDFVLTMNGVFV